MQSWKRKKKIAKQDKRNKNKKPEESKMQYFRDKKGVRYGDIKNKLNARKEHGSGRTIDKMCI